MQKYLKLFLVIIVASAVFSGCAIGKKDEGSSLIEPKIPLNYTQVIR